MGKILVIHGADFSAVSLGKVEIAIESIITANVNPSNSGTVSGAGKYYVGDTATLTATPANGFSFQKWDDGNTNNPRIVDVIAGGKTYTANFVEVEPMELVRTIQNSYINASGGISSFGGYYVYVYKTQANRIRVYHPSSGLQGVAFAAAYSDQDLSSASSIKMQDNYGSIDATIEMNGCNYIAVTINGRGGTDTGNKVTYTKEECSIDNLVIEELS